MRDREWSVLDCSSNAFANGSHPLACAGQRLVGYGRLAERNRHRASSTTAGLRLLERWIDTQLARARPIHGGSVIAAGSEEEGRHAVGG